MATLNIRSSSQTVETLTSARTGNQRVGNKILFTLLSTFQTPRKGKRKKNKAFSRGIKEQRKQTHLLMASFSNLSPCFNEQRKAWLLK